MVAPLARAGVTPNGLTLFGLFLNIVAGAVLATGALIPGGICVLIAGASDLFDGALARVTNQNTKFGAFLDSTLDRYSEAVVLLGVQAALLRSTEPAWMIWTGVLLCYVFAIGSLMVSYTRARAEGLGLRCEVGLLQRPERIAILGIGLLLPLPWLLAVLAALGLLTQFTVLQRIIHVWRLTSTPENNQ